jgi:hypothetical protein
MAAFREIVMRYVFAVLILLLGISSSLAQSHMGTPQEQQACSRDASRFCRQLAQSSNVCSRTDPG